VISKEIHPGIILLREVVSAREQVLSINNKLTNIVEFSVSFEGSAGITLKESRTLTRDIIVNPSKTEVLATVYMKGSWELKQAFRFTLKPPPQEVSQKLVSANKTALQTKIQASKQLISRISIDQVTPRQVIDATGNFTDPIFPPQHESIFRGSPVQRLKTDVVWRRPIEFMKGGAISVFLDDIEPNDIKQGMLGDCWLMCALAALSERPDLVRRMFLTKSVNQAGIYRVRLWKDAEVVTVTVDDYFPCFPEGLPVFSRSHGNELWVLLLEKAFAKLNGSYMLLRGGWAYEGMADLTGCPTETIEFDDEEAQLMLRRDEIWPLLLEADEEGGLMSASTPGEDRWTEARQPERKGGLVPGHAYTIIQVREAHGFRLLNIRNPWGSFEWDGNWSDRSPLWTPKMRAALNPILNSDDGTFWMNYEDFVANFSGINICWVSDYEEARMKGLFVRERVGTFDRVVPKKYYTVRPRRATKAYFGVHQPDERMYGIAEKASYLDIGLVVLKTLPDGQLEIVDKKLCVSERQVELSVDLEANVTYIIVPRTSGCAMQRPATPRRGTISLIESGELNAHFIVTLIDIFKKFQVSLDGFLSPAQFKKLFKFINIDIEDREITTVMQNYASTRQGLTLDGFFKYMFDKTQQSGAATMWRWLEAWGYDRDLYSIGARRFVFTIHSSIKLQVVMKKQVGSGISNTVDQLLLQTFGVQKSAVRAIRLYCLYEPKGNSFMYGVYNSGRTTTEAEFDATRSTGVIFGTGNPVTRCQVKADSWEILQYFQITKDAENCRINPQLKIRS